MSYDVYLAISTGPDPDAYAYAFSDNYTSNVAPMWRDAGIDLREWHGQPAIELCQPLRSAISDMTTRPDHYLALEPTNGWGDYNGALRFLIDLAAACETHPYTVVRVSS